MARNSASYNTAINGLRALCVLMVFAYHVENSGIVPFEPVGQLLDLVRGAAHSLRYGVEVFFMISGYVIVNSLRRHATPGSFLFDRVLRIFPVWVPLHLAICIAGPIGQWRSFEGLDAVGWFWLMLSNLLLLPPLFSLPETHPAAWSLTYEWVFYALATLGTWSAASSGRRGMALACAALVVLAIDWMPRGLFFLPGVIVALYEPWLKARPRLFSLALPSLAVFLASWLAVGFDAAEIGVPMTSVLGDVRAAWVAVAFVAGLHMFAAIASGHARDFRLLGSRFFQYLGDISYSFYLCHPIVMFAVKKLVNRWVVPQWGDVAGLATFAVVSFGLSLVASHLSNRLLEKRLAGWLKARFAAARPPASPVTAASLVSAGPRAARGPAR